MAQRIIEINSTNEDYLKIPKYKIIILGPMGSGKTALTFRFCEDKYVKAPPNIQIDCREKVIKIGNQYVLLQLWDTAGQERFAHCLTPSFYRNTHGVVFVFDTSSQQSYNEVYFWIKECRNFVESEVPMILVGTKCDKTEAVPENQARIFADLNNLPYFTTSAKNDEGAGHIVSIFTTLAYKMKEKRPLMKKDTINLDTTMLIEPPKRYCSKC